MSSPVTSSTVNGVNVSAGKAATSPKAAAPEQSNHQPNVRHIPIFVEGRDEPVMNRNLDTSSSSQSSDFQRASGSEKSPSGGTFDLYNRVKNFPVKTNFDNEFFQKAGARSASPGRTIPVKTNHQAPQQSSATTPPPPQASPKVPDVERKSPAPQPKPNSAQNPPQNKPEPPKQQPFPKEDLITKIANIQKDVQSLMDQVEKYTGTSRKDRQYLYLDEMLTQNLLKLDTIDTEGLDTIKQARRNAIKCINQCIAVLEQKTDAAAAKSMAPSQKEAATVKSSQK
ncbi:hypothetical protein DMENIID0001_082080 [Sergentomyia squamirostris]